MKQENEGAARNRRVVGLLELVLELEPALRGAYLENLGRQQPELQQQLLAHLRLLGGHDPENDATKAEARPAASGEMPERVGPYKVLREIGRGGMSRVYLAERADEEFERQVALKVIDQGLEAPIVHQRFLAERQILASFDCPQIAKLYDGGTLANGRPYLVMELVDGIRADQFCAENRLGLPERLVLFRKICGAVSYAHQQLVVHRDLKPSNILVTLGAEPKLLDFGIAKLLAPESFPLALSEKTRSHYRPMTPSYASPEQLLGEPITTATDVYALGVLLFQLLTGAVPHGGQEDRLQLVLRERAGETAPPKPSESLESKSAEETWNGQDRRRLARQLRGDLDNIVAKALRPQPADRYASVAELEEDLRRYAAGEPVRATSETPLYLLGKFLRRYRLPVAVAATVLLLVSAFAFVTHRQAQRITAERDRANEIRGFLANLIGSADSQSRRSGGVSLKTLLDENLAKLQSTPFRDPDAQFEILDLIGDGYNSLELESKAVEVYQLALQQEVTDRVNRQPVFLKISTAGMNSGKLAAAFGALQTFGKAPGDHTLIPQAQGLISLAANNLTAGQFSNCATNLHHGWEILEQVPNRAKLSFFAESLRDRATLAAMTQTDSTILRASGNDLTAVLLDSRSTEFTVWESAGRNFDYLGEPDLALKSYQYLFKSTQNFHQYGVARTRIIEMITDALIHLGRYEEAASANKLSAVTAHQYLALGPESPRAQYQVALADVRQGAILIGLGRQSEAGESLDRAIAILESMARDTEIIFAKSTLVRALILAGRLEEARPGLDKLLALGWRRPDLLRLAPEKGVLPDPLPPPLELDLSLPPKIRAYIDSLPHEPPPWETATDLPTIEEILAAEEARIAGPR